MAALNFTDIPQAKLNELSKLCIDRGLTLGFAESCTGGLLSAWVTTLPGVSKIFQGSVVSYAADLKTEILDVPNSLMRAHGQVSMPVAQAMARGARYSLNCSWSLSITGIAGPSGGTPEKPVGTVCFGVAGPGVESSKIKFFDSKLTRQEIQRQAALFALDFLLDAIK